MGAFPHFNFGVQAVLLGMDAQSGARGESQPLKNFQERLDDDASRLCLPQMVEKSAFESCGQKRCDGGNSKFLEQARAMFLDSFRADKQSLSDLRRGQTCGNRCQDFAFPWRKVDLRAVGFQ